MKINLLPQNNHYKKTNTNNNLKAKTDKNISKSIQTHNIYAYRDYNINRISFGERLNRTPENFYAQEFNKKNMPDTVRKYLEEDFETRHHMPPAQLQRLAFEYLKLADDIKEVKEIYPNEELFANLKTVDETKPSSGTLLLLKWDKQTSNTPIFKDPKEKDLTLYLLKKVYLEGKTIEEINKDFDKDATEAIKRELGVKNGQYFVNSTIRSLGIKYPNLSYYNSFLATRNDKEYIPPVRKQPETPRVISDETREKLSISSKSWWAGLNQIEREEQVKKMMNGKEFADSIFSKFQGQIMTIAAAKIGFSERLSQIFADKMNDDEFNADFPTFAEKSREIMLEFWNKDPNFKTIYSKATQETISDFDVAYHDKEHPEKLEFLINQALDLKSKILEKAKLKRRERLEMQKLAPKPKQQEDTKIEQKQNLTPIENYSKKEILMLFKQIEMDLLKYSPDIFAREFLDFAMQKVDYKTKLDVVKLNRPDAKELFNVDEDGLEKIKQEYIPKIEKINHEFDNQHRLISKTNEFIINNFLYEKTGNAAIFRDERGDSYDILVQNPKLMKEIITQKTLFNQQMKKLAKPMNQKEALELLKNGVLPKLKEMALDETNDYNMPDNIMVNLQTIKNSLDTSTTFKNESIKFIQSYNGYAKLLNQTDSEEVKKAILEHIAADYFIYMSEKYTISHNNAKQDEELSTKGTAKKILTPKYNVDFSSMKSLKKAFKALSTKDTKFYSNEFRETLTDYILNHPEMRKEVISAYVGLEIGQAQINIEPQKIREVKESLDKINEEISKDFEREYSLLSKANEFAMNKTLYELTNDCTIFKNTRNDSSHYIKENHIEEQYNEKTSIVDNRYRLYTEKLSTTKAEDFYNNILKKQIKTIRENGFKYYEDMSLESQKSLSRYLLFQADESLVIDYIRNYKGAVEFVTDDKESQDAKDIVLEHIIHDILKNLIPDIIMKDI